MGTGSLLPLDLVQSRTHTLILQVPLTWRQLTIHFSETSVCLCEALSANQDWGEIPCLGTAHRRKAPIDLFLCLEQSVSGERGGIGGKCPRRSILLSQGQFCRLPGGWPCLGPTPLACTAPGSPPWGLSLCPSPRQPAGGTSRDTLGPGREPVPWGSSPH